MNSFSKDVLKLDYDSALKGITSSIKEQVLGILRRKGVVIGLSGGVDSTVCAALCVRALGPERVYGLLMPERSASRGSDARARTVAQDLRISFHVEDISPTLDAIGCYTLQDEAIQSVFPEYASTWKFKLSLPSAVSSDRLPIMHLVVQTDRGEILKRRMTSDAYQQLVAATNFKQRIRKTLEYYHADKMHYAVCGTPNRLEYVEGFFVKNGDGSADLKPIAHLYKTQVYQLAVALGVHRDILEQTPSTDTYSLDQTQEEFFFGLPYIQSDCCLYALENGFAPGDVAPAIGLTEEQVTRVFEDIQSKRRAAQYLHAVPLLVQPVTFASPTGN